MIAVLRQQSLTLCTDNENDSDDDDDDCDDDGDDDDDGDHIRLSSPTAPSGAKQMQHMPSDMTARSVPLWACKLCPLVDSKLDGHMPALETSW
jgi:hypothetical protein